MVCYEKINLKEIDDLIIDSLGIVAFISFFFVGGVVAIQTALNLTNPFLNTLLVLLQDNP
jgi:phospholipid/cholesterol/gamma-HCH transport system permease protein